MIATIKQLRYISNLIYQKRGDTEYLNTIYQETPKNNDTYPDLRCDYTQTILADRLKNLTSGQVDYILKAWSGEKGYKAFTARDIIISNIIN